MKIYILHGIDEVDSDTGHNTGFRSKILAVGSSMPHMEREREKYLKWYLALTIDEWEV